MTKHALDITARDSLTAYLVAGTGAVATAMASGSADAGVITGGPQGLNSNGVAGLDFNGDGAFEFAVYRWVDNVGDKLTDDYRYSARLHAEPGATGHGFFHAAQGQLVFGGSGFSPPRYSLYSNSTSEPSSLLVGLTFNHGVGPLFGWIRFASTYDPFWDSYSFRIDSWAYNDTGAPMLAGEFAELGDPDPEPPPPPPPPSSGVPGPHSLLLLAGGLAGIGAYRRKRQVAA